MNATKATPSAGTNPILAVFRWLWWAIGSMQLTVLLLLILGLLTWLGTLAQVDQSLFLVQKDYFESTWVMAKLPLSFWGQPLFDRPLIVPLPGAYLVMAVLFVNLLVGGFLRLKWRVRTIGVAVCHTGIALLLVAGFTKLHYSYSGSLALFEAPASGESLGDRVTESATFVSFHDHELALLRELPADGAGVGMLEERVVPEAALVKARGDRHVLLPAAGLPFRVEVFGYCDNSEVRRADAKGMPPTGPVVGGLWLLGIPPTDKREADVAGCYVRVVPERGQPIVGIVTGEDLRPITAHRSPFTFQVDGQRFGLDLRRVHYDLPFKVRLDRFQKDDHPGTGMARDYRSSVTVTDLAGTQQARIFMNNPLRKAGFVLYQSSYGQARAPTGSGAVHYTVLEVANNPSDKWPEYACWVIFLGLLLHFGLKLVLFLLSATRQVLAGIQVNAS